MHETGVCVSARERVLIVRLDLIRSSDESTDVTLVVFAAEHGRGVA